MEVKQGTMIYGMRSKKYPSVLTYGMIISASCDLAQEKIDKVYYLTAISLDDWIFSEAGFKKILTSRVNDIENNLMRKCEDNGINWGIIKSFSTDELHAVTKEIFRSSKEQESINNQFEKYKIFTSNNIFYEEKKKILADEKRHIKNFLREMINGKQTHYIFVPIKAFEWDIDIQHGMIIDLQELNYLDFEDIIKLSNCCIDEKVLNEREKNKYDERFFILNDPGFAILNGSLVPPWTEYVMQHFSNSFIRIGVDTLRKDEIDIILEKIFE